VPWAGVPDAARQHEEGGVGWWVPTEKGKERGGGAPPGGGGGGGVGNEAARADHPVSGSVIVVRSKIWEPE